MLQGGSCRGAIPQGNRSVRGRRQPCTAHGLTDEIGHPSTREIGYPSQSGQVFFRQVDLRSYHVGHFASDVDTYHRRERAVTRCISEACALSRFLAGGVVLKAADMARRGRSNVRKRAVRLDFGTLRQHYRATGRGVRCAGIRPVRSALSEGGHTLSRCRGTAPRRPASASARRGRPARGRAPWPSSPPAPARRGSSFWRARGCSGSRS